MSATAVTPGKNNDRTPADERVAKVGLAGRLLSKPELGSVIGLVLIFLLFSALSPVFHEVAGIANWLDPASTIGIMAVAVALLMIGGHFDLSAGVQLGTAGLVTGILSTHFHVIIWVAMLLGLAVCLLVGFVNGVLVVKTGLPSFIVTLASFLMLQGLNLGLTKLITNEVQVENVADVPGYDLPAKILSTTVPLFGQDFQITILWWIVWTVVASWLLMRTRFGNWIFATGGDPNASRNVGVPTQRTTIALFMIVSACAWFIGTTQVLRLGSIQANAGFGLELTFIVAAVIGGCRLTGGYGSALGAAIGALIFGMTSQGIVYAGWDSDWFKFFLGAMLLLAVLANEFVQRRASRSKRG